MAQSTIERVKWEKTQTKDETRSKEHAFLGEDEF